MKTVMSEVRVEDIYGVIEDLKKQGFAVLNVAVDRKGTYVYLDDKEEKDPLPVILEWIGRPVPAANSREWKRRIREARRGSKPSILGRIFGLFSRKPKPEEPAPVEPEKSPEKVDPQFYRKLM